MSKEKITVLVSFFMVLIFLGINLFVEQKDGSQQTIRVGFVYDGDESAPYTYNFIRAQRALENKYGSRVEIIAMSNIFDENCEETLRELVRRKCDIIFTTSYGYGEAAKKIAQENPQIQFCQATCSNANETPKLDNYHTFMGKIYEGRYISGVVAGMKLKELAQNGLLTPEEMVIGYVAAFPYAEVISGYTAFFLGVRAVVPEAVMQVKYTNTWANYSTEKECAEELIANGCILISQHSDTVGPAVACENASADRMVFHVGYNQSMQDVAPTTSLVSSRINWTPYILGAVEAVLRGEKIEKRMDADINGNDAGAGMEKDWVQVVELNELIAAKGTSEKIREIEEAFRHNRLKVFQGEYTGVDPFDPDNTYDLRKGYSENENSSAPTFHYVLQDVITVLE